MHTYLFFLIFVSLCNPSLSKTNALEITPIEKVKTFSRNRIRVVGSSTVFPFSSALAEYYSTLSRFRAPIIESTGSGGGIYIFCRGSGSTTPDMVNASRPMTLEEKLICRKNGVEQVWEFVLGQDGLALTALKEGDLQPFSLTLKDLYHALSTEIEKDGKIQKNPHYLWSDIRPDLPKRPIKVLGSPPTAGTYDILVHKALKPFCKNNPALKAKCGQIRNDGVYTAASEHSSVITQKLLYEPGALGLIGYNFYCQNKDLLWAATLNQHKPSLETISSGAYPLSYALYFYLKGDHLKSLCGLKEWATLLLSEKIISEEGFLVRIGLVPLAKKERAQQRKNLKKALVNSKMNHK